MEQLATARFRLEPLTASHATKLFKALSAPEIYRYIARNPPEDVTVLATRYRQLEARGSADGSETWLNWAIYVPNEDRFVGKVQATVYRDRLEASLAYLLAPSHWGIGCANEVCIAVIEHLQRRWGVFTIEATTDTRNERSIRLLERLGFQRVETRDSDDIVACEASREHVYKYRRPPSL